MNDLWFKVRGYVAAGVALVACPCHLLVALPLLLSLTAGTALGVFLQQNTWLVVGASALLFVAGLFLTFRWLGQPTAVADTQARRPRPQRQGTPAPTQSSSHRMPKVTRVHTPGCSTLRQGLDRLDLPAQGKLCSPSQTNWNELQEGVGEVNSTVGRYRENG